MTYAQKSLHPTEYGSNTDPDYSVYYLPVPAVPDYSIIYLQYQITVCIFYLQFQITVSIIYLQYQITVIIIYLRYQITVSIIYLQYQITVCIFTCSTRLQCVAPAPPLPVPPYRADSGWTRPGGCTTPRAPGWGLKINNKLNNSTK